MTTTRKQHTPAFKARVAMEAIRGEKTLSQLGSQFKVHPIQIGKWRKAAIEQLPELFVDGRTRKGQPEESGKEALYEEIGRLKVELDWLKKKSWHARLRICGPWWIAIMRRSASGASASCWAQIGRACIISRWAKAKRTCS